MKVGLLTLEQKDSLTNKEFSEDSLFNPIQDKNGNCVISIEEIEQANSPYEWVNELPLIEYEPIEHSL